jgi:hypothetical protein
VEADKKVQRVAESANHTDYPSPQDILLGKGKPYQDFRGNVCLWEIIEYNRSLHQTSASKDLTHIQQASKKRVVCFLKCDEGGLARCGRGDGEEKGFAG